MFMKHLFFIIGALFISLACFAQTSQPYSQYYGYNSNCSEYGCSEISVTAPTDANVVVIVKYLSGRVAGHKYIYRGSTSTIQVKDGTYNVFFYCGNQWNSQKQMGSVIGGFNVDESFSKDPSVTVKNQRLSYTLQSVINGNFQTKSSSKQEMFK